jgi:cell filamentation protein
LKHKYHYEDPDFLYTDKQTGVMYNKFNITNNSDLIIAETYYAYKRATELEKKRLKIKDSKTIFVIHKHIFQDIYEWAGKPRQVETIKNDHQFHPTSRFRQGFEYLDKLISRYNMIDSYDKQQIADSLAKILDTLNELHPFREGNGRTQRMFLYHLAKNKNYKLKLNPPDNPEIYQKYMEGTSQGNINLLTTLIFDNLQWIQTKQHSKHFGQHTPHT